MYTKNISAFFENGLNDLVIENKLGVGVNFGHLDKINNMQIQNNDVRDIIESLILNNENLICLDYNDVRSVLSVEGAAFVSIAYSRGKVASTKALDSIVQKLMSTRTITEGTTMMINFIGNKEIGIFEVTNAFNEVVESLDVEPEVFFSVTVNEELDGEVYVVAIVTGL